MNMQGLIAAILLALSLPGCDAKPQAGKAEAQVETSGAQDNSSSGVVPEWQRQALQDARAVEQTLLEAEQTRKQSAP